MSMAQRLPVSETFVDKIIAEMIDEDAQQNFKVGSIAGMSVNYAQEISYYEFDVIRMSKFDTARRVHTCNSYLIQWGNIAENILLSSKQTKNEFFKWTFSFPNLIKYI